MGFNFIVIAHLRQNKPFPLLYLGHAQIIKFKLKTEIELMILVTVTQYILLSKLQLYNFFPDFLKLHIV